MPYAVAFVGLVVALAGLRLGVVLAASFNQLADRWLTLQERKSAPPTGNSPDEPMPSDIVEYCHRLQRKESRESEEAYARELFHKLGKDWTKVRVALDLARVE